MALLGEQLRQSAEAEAAAKTRCVEARARLDLSAKGEAKLIKVSDASGTLEQTEVASGSLSREMLDPDDVFLVDNQAEIYVWVGKGATKEERKGGMRIGTDYCSQGGRPKGTKVVMGRRA